MKAFVLAIILLLFLATMSTTVASCNNVPSMKIEDACKACFGKWDGICQEILQSAPDPAEITTYVLMVTKKAQQNYASTMNMINAELGVGNHTDEAKKTLIHCKKMFEEADRRMASGAAHVSGCNFKEDREEYGDALADITSCAERARDTFLVWLSDKVSVSYDLTLVAESLDIRIHNG